MLAFGSSIGTSYPESYPVDMGITQPQRKRVVENKR
jgi:hypothetical protein